MTLSAQGALRCLWFGAAAAIAWARTIRPSCLKRALIGPQGTELGGLRGLRRWDVAHLCGADLFVLPRVPVSGGESAYRRGSVPEIALGGWPSI